MKKRFIALFLTIACLACCFTGCHDKKIDGENYKGAEIRMFLSEQVYELDPAFCLNNTSAQLICSLIYDTLFKLDENGKIVPSLVKSYEILKDEKNKEYKMVLTLRDDTFWSDGTYVSAEDVIYSFKRILDPEFNSDAAALLFDIRNAAEAKQGDMSIDDVAIASTNELDVEITFVDDIDYDAFLLNLTSVALAPLREDIVKRNVDWSKKPATTTCSGPFLLRRVNYGFDGYNNADITYASLVLERNAFYRRLTNDRSAKTLDKAVTPYRLIIDMSKTKEELLDSFSKGELFFIGDIALSARANYKDSAVVNDLLSTHTYYLNENAEIAKKDGTTEKLFANKNVRLALSAAIDRQAIADAVVFAKAATALVPEKVFETTSAKKTFRSVGGDMIAASADLTKANEYITASGINPSDYSFSIMVKAKDEVHQKVAEMVAASWTQLGFNVTVDTNTIEINGDKAYGEDVRDIYDDLFDSRFLKNDYQVAAVDLRATVEAFSVLAPFATRFSGQGQDMTAAEYVDVPHKTGYANEAYNALIETAFAAKGEDEAKALHDAEKLLIEDMPVIPVLFNQSAYIISGDLSKFSVTYDGFYDFRKVKQKNWTEYIVVETEGEEGAPETPAE